MPFQHVHIYNVTKIAIFGYFIWGTSNFIEWMPVAESFLTGKENVLILAWFIMFRKMKCLDVFICCCRMASVLSHAFEPCNFLWFFSTFERGSIKSLVIVSKNELYLNTFSWVKTIKRNKPSEINIYVSQIM